MLLSESFAFMLISLVYRIDGVGMPHFEHSTKVLFWLHHWCYELVGASKFRIFNCAAMHSLLQSLSCALISFSHIDRFVFITIYGPSHRVKLCLIMYMFVIICYK